MKNITKKSIREDIKVINTMLKKYSDAIFESQEGQMAHYDNQSKLVKLAIEDVMSGLFRVNNALILLGDDDLKIIED